MFARALFILALAVSASAQTAKNDYSDPKTWLCRPGRQDACAVDLTTTIVAADGTLKREEFKPNANPPIDCFYVYPTVSLDTVQSKLVSALLLGTSLAVPKDKDVGGAFQHVPVCRSATQTGCVIAYASFRSTIPPPANSRFGRVQDGTMQAVCANPAALAGGSGQLYAYLSTAGLNIVGSSKAPAWAAGKTIDTPWVSVPGLLTAQCVVNEQGSYLEVTVHGDPSDPRADDIVGDVMTNGQVNASWGLHLIDVNLAMGNLVDVVGQQARAYLRAHRKSQ